MCFAIRSKVRYFVVVRNAVGVDSRASSDMSNGVLQLYGKRAEFLFFGLTTKSFSCN